MSTRSGWWLAALFCLGAAAPIEPPEARAETFVRAFYDWYLAKDGGIADVLREKRPYLSPALARALEADAKEGSASEGDNHGLDFDPFLNAQETALRYEVGQATGRQGRYRVPLYAYWDADRSKRDLALTAEVHAPTIVASWNSPMARAAR